jgi:hypothetical protein
LICGSMLGGSDLMPVSRATERSMMRRAMGVS